MNLSKNYKKRRLTKSVTCFNARVNKVSKSDPFQKTRKSKSKYCEKPWSGELAIDFGSNT